MTTKSAHDELEEWAAETDRRLVRAHPIELITRAIAEHGAVKKENMGLTHESGHLRTEIAELKSQLTALQKERDEICGALDSLRQSIYCDGTAKAFHKSLRQEITELKSQLEQAQKCCAEMRGVLEHYRPYHQGSPRIDHALSSDCGKNMATPEQVGVLKDWIAGAMEVLTEVAAYGSCDCNIPEGFVCDFCRAANLNNEARRILNETPK